MPVSDHLTVPNSNLNPDLASSFQPPLGALGTSVPGKYVVLADENDLTADDIQKMTYWLCHTYPRCQKTASLPPTVWYAHLLVSICCQTASWSRFQSPESLSKTSFLFSVTGRKSQQVPGTLPEKRRGIVHQRLPSGQTIGCRDTGAPNAHHRSSKSERMPALHLELRNQNGKLTS